MRDRTIPDLMLGALACVSVLGLYAITRETVGVPTRRRTDEETTMHRRASDVAKWELPRQSMHRETPEDYCRHCTGSGVCESCGPASCRICRGSGVQPQDASLLPRLSLMWDGVR
jgi:hypothetical protein